MEPGKVPCCGHLLVSLRAVDCFRLHLIRTDTLYGFVQRSLILDRVESVEEGGKDLCCEHTPMGYHLVVFGALGGLYLLVRCCNVVLQDLLCCVRLPILRCLVK